MVNYATDLRQIWQRDWRSPSPNFKKRLLVHFRIIAIFSMRTVRKHRLGLLRHISS